MAALLNKYIALFILCAFANFNKADDDDGGLVEECAKNEIAFGCKFRFTGVVIKEAWFFTDYFADRCTIPPYNLPFKKSSILDDINKKCSTKRICRFNVLEDIPGAKEAEEKWNKGVVRLNYECVDRETFIRKCAHTISTQSGWLSNIGYPKYYLGPGQCTLTIKVDVGQHISLEIIDLSVRDILQPLETSCRDRVTVMEGDIEHLNTCGDSNRPIRIRSKSNVLNVSLHSADDVFPKRGFLGHFEAIGCQTPAIPEDGYLGHRNATHAEFWCLARHVFPDTLDRMRNIRCFNNKYWDLPVPDCTDLDDLLAWGNITMEEYLLYNGSNPSYQFYKDKELFYDIVVPAIIMTSLVVGNIGVLILIIYCRRGLKDEYKEIQNTDLTKPTSEETIEADNLATQRI